MKSLQDELNENEKKVVRMETELKDLREHRNSNVRGNEGGNAEQQNAKKPMGKK